MSPRRIAWPLLSALLVAARAVATPCPGEGIVTIVGDNRSADLSVSLGVSGTRIASPDGCDAAGTGLATSYATTVECAVAGPSKCGRVEGLAPGVWVHRVSVQVDGSAIQLQAQRGAVLAAGAPAVSNVVEWTVFGRTFVVTQASPASLVPRLEDAAAYTGSAPQPALVRFDRATFPGASDPKTIALQTSPTCALDTCQPDGRQTGYCLEGSRITVDALDDDANPGGVVLTVGPCNNSLMRVYGSDDVLRGLTFLGSADETPSFAVDTIAIAGAAARRNRVEQSRIVGPTLGDGVSVEGDAGQPDGDPSPENVLVETEVLGAEDKGIKVAFGGVARVERSCVHDNANGGVQVTLGGTVTAVENVVQHNLGGPAQNGLFVGVPETVGDPNVLTTRGNVVRFNGARGVSVVNAGTATLAHDVVTDNYQAGLRVETALADVVPAATVRGGTYACNYAPGLCLSGGGQGCRADADCALQVCNAASGASAIKGAGVTLTACALPGCLSPDPDLGAGGADSGRNAFTLNANPAASGLSGINVSSAIQSASAIPAAGNQWEHCDVPEVDPINPNKCNMTQVETLDVRIAPGTAALTLGEPTGPRHGPDPAVVSVTPPRPRAGDLVRVYGGQFNAIDGAACHPAGLPADPCSAENPAVVAKNAGDLAQGNRVTVTIDGTPFAADVHQVTPTMLAFRMPVDCFAPATLTVARGNDTAGDVTLCDPAGCAGRPVGALCDDDDVCTLGETCQANGTCAGATPLDCTGQCLTGTCDPMDGCIAQPASAPCEDGDACTVGDHCDGAGDTCVSGGPRACTAPCLTGGCDAGTGCVPRDATAACDDADACTEGDHCSGTDATCAGSPAVCDDGTACTVDGCDAVTGCTFTAQPDGSACADTDPCRGPAACLAGACDQGTPVSCDDGDACTADGCDEASGCTHVPVPALPGVTCHVAQLRTLVAALPGDASSLARALGARIDCVEDRVAAAEAATGARPRARQVRRARRCVAKLLTKVKRARDVTAATRAELRREAEDTRAALDAYFAS